MTAVPIPSLSSEKKLSAIYSDRTKLMQEMRDSPRTLFFVQHYEKLWKETEDKLARALSYRDMCETLQVRNTVLERFVIGTPEYTIADDALCLLLHSKTYRVQEEMDWPKYFEGRDITNYAIYYYFNP